MNVLRSVALAGLGVMQLLGLMAITPPGTLAQEADSSYADPAGRYTMSWEAPWEILRLEDGLMVLGDGILVVIPVASAPLDTSNTQFCLNELIAAAGGDGTTTFSILAQLTSTWRSYVAYQNDSVGAVDYFECQMLPDGSGFVGFIGGTSLGNFDQHFTRLTEFLGETVDRPSGEPSQVLGVEGWRIGMVEWVRGSLYSELSLPAKSGKDWIIAVVDITNQQADSEKIPLKAFGIRDTETGKIARASESYSQKASTRMGELPGADGTSILVPAEQRRRAMLVFSINSTWAEIEFEFEGKEMDIGDKKNIVRFIALRSPGNAAALEPATVNEVVDGRTLIVTIDATGESATVQLIGLAEPGKGDCFTVDATNRLKKLAGSSVMLERDATVEDGSVLLLHVWSADQQTLINAELVEDGFAPATTDDHRFAGMLSSAEATAQAKPSGLWGACQSDTEALTEEERAYLTGLLTRLDRLDNANADMRLVVADGVLEESEGMLLFLGIFLYDSEQSSLITVEPPARFAELHASFLDALFPLAEQANAATLPDGATAAALLAETEASLAAIRLEVETLLIEPEA